MDEFEHWKETPFFRLSFRGHDVYTRVRKERMNPDHWHRHKHQHQHKQIVSQSEHMSLARAYRFWMHFYFYVSSKAKQQVLESDRNCAFDNTVMLASCPLYLLLKVRSVCSL